MKSTMIYRGIDIYIYISQVVIAGFLDHQHNAIKIQFFKISISVYGGRWPVLSGWKKNRSAHVFWAYLDSKCLHFHLHELRFSALCVGWEFSQPYFSRRHVCDEFFLSTLSTVNKNAKHTKTDFIPSDSPCLLPL